MEEEAIAQVCIDNSAVLVVLCICVPVDEVHAEQVRTKLVPCCSGIKLYNMPSVVPRLPSGFTTLPDESTYVLANCSVPAACLNSSTEQHTDDPDRLVACDILVSNGIIREIGSLSDRGDAHPTTDLEGGLCFPAFVDLHTHIGAVHATCIRNLLFLGLCFVDQIRPDSCGGLHRAKTTQHCRQRPHLREKP